MTSTTLLQLPLLASSQAQKHVTHNEALLRLDGLTQLAALSSQTEVEPTLPADGSVYVLPPNKSGVHWGPASSGAVAHYYDGSWHFYAPKEGWRCYVLDEAALLVFRSSNWEMVAPPGYSEGSWSPDLRFGGGNIGLTYSFCDGCYRKMGRFVYVQCAFGLSSKGTSTGPARIEGLPFPIGGAVNQRFGMSIAYLEGLHCSTVPLFSLYQGNNSVEFLAINSGSPPTTLTDTAFTATANIQISGSYFV